MSRRRNRFTLTTMVIVMAVLAIFVGYLLGNWLIQVVTGGENSQGQLAGEKIIEEEIIEDNEEQETINKTQKQDYKEGEEDYDYQPEKETIPSPTNTEDVFVVQVGAFQKYDNALSLKNELAEKGYKVVITEGIPYKVQLGKSNKKEDAEKIEEEVETLGYDAFITH